ncbi:alpha/beta fold hydrolase [Rhodococcus sp. P1Y]|uniref:alpha/beta fold hydrolase n=1 Tax=Rhodococcus sp. P1Y TaxID=1302308 RepID=UPI000EB2625C|nr:alpha/beta fold hydrolase [Rhodococcus sp. P1Y]AYJ47787.1 alpha/beta fold hydrolase [Rhodococcus sp. P1Y]
MSVHRVEAPIHAPLAPLCRPDSRETVLDRLCEVAHSVPDAIAIRTGNEAVTFDELLHRTYATARKIACLVPGAPRPIAVAANSTVDSMITMLAVMASGHSLVPLDVNLPEQRAAHIVETCSAVRLDSTDLSLVEDSAIPLPAFTGSRTALIAFTSGSTGTAKGVVLSHRMCLTKAYEVSSALGLTSRDRVGNALPVSFGAGINTLFAGLLSGATVYCQDPRSTQSASLPDWIERSSLTTLHCSPSLVRSLPPVTDAISAVPENAVPSLRVVITYGEALHSRDVMTFRTALGSGASFVNWYATTEAGAVAYDVYDADRSLPAGFLGAGTLPRGKRVEIVDQAGTAVSPGQVGEIRVTGECLADGYLGLTDLTRARFSTEGRLHRYATGDLGRFDENGHLQLLGRADDAVKIRGYLVEPAEVEAALRSTEGVTDVAVVPRSIGEQSHLDAYFVGATLDADLVRERLQCQLPSWMIPRNITRLDRIERNERGKVDRQKLPEADATELLDPGTAGSEAPRGATELWVTTIVASVIGTTTVRADADFTALGAGSLALTQISVGVQRAFHVELSIEELVGAMSVSRLAAIIDAKLSSIEKQAERPRGGNIAVPLRTSGSLAPLFVIAGGGVPAVGLAALADRLDHDRPVYAIQAKGMADRAIPDRTIGAAARTYVREIRKIQPSGPYFLAGHSLGGWIALEVAHRLRAEGDVVAHVTLLDPRLFRHLLDRLPGGKTLASAPADQVTAAAPKKKIWATAGLVSRVVAAGILRFSTTERWLAFGIIGSLALSIHRPTPWDGPVTAIVTRENTADRRSWAAVATGELSIHHVDGRHVDMVRDPVAGDVAKVIDSALSDRTRALSDRTRALSDRTGRINQN